LTVPARPAIIWDFNGTILDDFALCLRLINHMLARRGLRQITADDYLEVFDFPVQNYYRQIGFDFLTEPFPDLAAEYMALYQPASLSCPLRRGIPDALAALRNCGCDQILLSASRKDLLLEQVGHFKLDGYFQSIIALDDILGRSKMDLACSWFAGKAVQPAWTVLVGDTTHDHAVARTLGCGCLLVSGGHNSRRRLQETGAPVLAEPADLMKHINDKKGLFTSILAKSADKCTEIRENPV
jgi:phosphoglycolate phosphatase